ncbi:MAG TPA: ATP-binding protein [Nocardioidaceae bacterium]|nr:ATP-binding protein [Nocardioidaceae bacterium]
MRYLTNPVVQFLAAGLVVLVVVVAGTLQLSRDAADQEAIADARATTELLASSVAAPAIPLGLVDVDPAAVDRFDRTVLRRLKVEDVKRIKIWRADGMIVYSDQSELIGKTYALGADEREVLADGGSDAEISNLRGFENRFERDLGGLLEVYTRIESPEGEPLLFEAYFSASDIAERRQEVYDAFQPMIFGGPLVLVAVTTPLLWVLTRRLERSARDRERLLEAAADASESERRRIARDLHDGVVQDLAGTSFALSATVRDTSTPHLVAQRLAPMSGSLRSSLRSLRSLLVEIYPPDLGVDGLSSALEDLVAPAVGAGVAATVEVRGAEHASEASVRLVWRVAQEAVRNATRHANAEHLSVRVQMIGRHLVLDVTDDGDGFEPQHESGGIGLRGLRDLIREARGRLDVRTAPGQGTTVHLEVQP